MSRFRCKLNTAILFFFIWSTNLLASDILPKIGNFSLGISQQPGSLISIGQTILEKKQSQINLILQSPQFKGCYTTSFIPNFTYGLTDQFTLQIAVPVTLQAKKISFAHRV